VASLIGGALLIEVTFSWPGIALRLQEAISQRDYPVVQGIVVVIAALVALVSVAVDLLVPALDPRIKYSRNYKDKVHIDYCKKVLIGSTVRLAYQLYRSTEQSSE
tara:strand:- start:605 stop:919 length:315 start_codon:yes stop_codon:yes gene_type:complete